MASSCHIHAIDNGRINIECGNTKATLHARGVNRSCNAASKLN